MYIYRLNFEWRYTGSLKLSESLLDEFAMWSCHSQGPTNNLKLIQENNYCKLIHLVTS